MTDLTARRRTALLGYLGFLALLALATAVQPASYRSTRDYISGLAAMDAAHPWIMVAGFQAAAVGLAAAALVLFRLLPSVPGRIATVLMLVSAAATSVAGFARFDCSRNDAACQAQVTAGMSVHSQIHGHAALFVFLPLILSSFLLGLAVWRSGSPVRGRLALLALGCAVVQLVLIVAVEEQHLAVTGLAQRIAVLVQLGLPTLLAVGRWGFATDRAPAPEPALVGA